jgi:adenylate kinase family enzyme
MRLINIFGAPGTGKSTTSAGIFHNLKLKGLDVEYVQEYAKDKTWQSDFETLKCQPYVTGKQLFRLHRLRNKVEYVVTDAPILNGILYQDEYATPNWNN